MSSGVAAQLQASFTPEVSDVLVDALERAYDTACEHHDPARGGNAQVFGYSLYHFALHEISAVGVQQPESVKVLSRQPLFRVQIGEYLAACHKVGNSERDDIHKCFPRGHGPAEMVEQLEMFDSPAPDISNNKNVVIAHMGNPEDGLRAVYLCIPSKTAADQVIEWGFAKQIWPLAEAELVAGAPFMAASATEKTAATLVMRPAAPAEPAFAPAASVQGSETSQPSRTLPAEEVIAEPEVRLKQPAKPTAEEK